MSNYYSILAAVQAQCATIVPNSVVRRKLFRLESDTFPIIYIAPKYPIVDKIYKKAFGGIVQYQYDVTVCYAAPGAADMVTGFDTFLANREAIRNILYQPLLAGVTEVFDTKQEPDTKERFEEFLGSDYDFCGWTFGYVISEEMASS